jgi:hypothetical protein
MTSETSGARAPRDGTMPTRGALVCLGTWPGRYGAGTGPPGWQGGHGPPGQCDDGTGPPGGAGRVPRGTWPAGSSVLGSGPVLSWAAGAAVCPGGWQGRGGCLAPGRGPGCLWCPGPPRGALPCVMGGRRAGTWPRWQGPCPVAGGRCLAGWPRSSVGRADPGRRCSVPCHGRPVRDRCPGPGCPGRARGGRYGVPGALPCHSLEGAGPMPGRLAAGALQRGRGWRPGRGAAGPAGGRIVPPIVPLHCPVQTHTPPSWPRHARVREGPGRARQPTRSPFAVSKVLLYQAFVKIFREIFLKIFRKLFSARTAEPSRVRSTRRAG